MLRLRYLQAMQARGDGNMSSTAVREHQPRNSPFLRRISRRGSSIARQFCVTLLIGAILGLPSPSSRAGEKKVGIRLMWRERIGYSSGSAVVHQGKVLIGTNNSVPRDLTLRDDRGVMMCFDHQTGALLGQVMHARLAHRQSDIPGLGIWCRPYVEENRAYYVSNRGELVCVFVAFSLPCLSFLASLSLYATSSLE